MSQIEQIFFNVPLVRLEPIFKSWVRDVIAETPSSEPLPDQEQKFNSPQLANYLKVTKATIHSYKKRGIFKFYQTGRTVYFKKSEVDAALAVNTRGGLKNG